MTANAKRVPRIPHEVFINEDLNTLPAMTRWLFLGLLSLADETGLLEDRPRRIKAQVLPYDDADVDDMLDHLAQVGLINRQRDHDEYPVGVVTMIAIERWDARWLIPEPDGLYDDEDSNEDE